MGHRTKASAAEAHESGIARLVEAERQWREELAAAERAAEELIAEARRVADEEDAALERDLADCVAAERAKVAADLQRRIDGIEREARVRADRYRALPDAAVERLAARLLAEVWWPDVDTPAANAGVAR